jgi:hypothetical protein
VRPQYRSLTLSVRADDLDPSSIGEGTSPVSISLSSLMKGAEDLVRFDPRRITMIDQLSG